jgi:hypothetical protein
VAVLTIHSLDPAVDKRVRAKARREHKSLNQALKELLAESVGITAPTVRDHRADFKEFVGVWSEADAHEFAAASADFERIDAEDWR